VGETKPVLMPPPPQREEKQKKMVGARAYVSKQDQETTYT